MMKRKMIKGLGMLVMAGFLVTAVGKNVNATENQINENTTSGSEQDQNDTGNDKNDNSEGNDSS